MEEEFWNIDNRRAWNSVFQSIRAESANSTFLAKEATKEAYKRLNRYRDVFPYDHSRIRLIECDPDYINASLVEVPEARRKYILTQGPLDCTVGHFWLMVFEQNTNAIVMLNRCIEKNFVKCYQYWPSGKSNGGEDELMIEEHGLCVSFLSEESAPNYTIKKFMLYHCKKRESKIVLHYHYTTWPDFGVPESPTAFLNFLFAVRDSGFLENDKGPAIIHCSAGIGRSGTFCLVDSCLCVIEKMGDINSINVKEMLIAMRSYRMGLIQTADQLRFSYLAIIKGARLVLGQEGNIVSSEAEMVKLVPEGSEAGQRIFSKEALSHSDSSDEGIANSNTCTSTSATPPPFPPRALCSNDTSSSTSESPPLLIDNLLQSFIDNSPVTPDDSSVLPGTSSKTSEESFHSCMEQESFYSCSERESVGSEFVKSEGKTRNQVDMKNAFKSEAVVSSPKTFEQKLYIAAHRSNESQVPAGGVSLEDRFVQHVATDLASSVEGSAEVFKANLVNETNEDIQPVPENVISNNAKDPSTMR